MANPSTPTDDVMRKLLQELAEAYGYQLNPLQNMGWTDIFFYQFPTISNVAAAGGTQQQQVNIQATSDFEWIASSFQFNVAAAAITRATQNVPNMRVQLQETGSGKYMQNAPVPVTSIFGYPGEPMYLPQPKILKKSTTLAVIATNDDAAVATGNLYLTLIGRQVFTASQ